MVSVLQIIENRINSFVKGGGQTFEKGEIINLTPSENEMSVFIDFLYPHNLREGQQIKFNDTVSPYYNEWFTPTIISTTKIMITPVNGFYAENSNIWTAETTTYDVIYLAGTIDELQKLVSSKENRFPLIMLTKYDYNELPAGIIECESNLTFIIATSANDKTAQKTREIVNFENILRPLTEQVYEALNQIADKEIYVCTDYNKPTKQVNEFYFSQNVQNNLSLKCDFKELKFKIKFLRK